MISDGIIYLSKSFKYIFNLKHLYLKSILYLLDNVINENHMKFCNGLMYLNNLNTFDISCIYLYLVNPISNGISYLGKYLHYITSLKTLSINGIK